MDIPEMSAIDTHSYWLSLTGSGLYNALLIETGPGRASLRWRANSKVCHDRFVNIYGFEG